LMLRGNWERGDWRRLWDRSLIGPGGDWEDDVDELESK